jgi:hypothetical protein
MVTASLGPVARRPQQSSKDRREESVDGTDAPASFSVRGRALDQRSDEFSFGEYGTSYSASFTGYSDYASLSPGPPDEPYEPRPAKPPTQVPSIGKLAGTVISAKGVPRPDRDGGGTFVIVRIVDINKTEVAEAKRTGAVPNTAEPAWDFKFEFNKVTKNLALEFLVTQSTKTQGDKQVAYGRVKVRGIPIEEPRPQEVPLVRPLQPGTKLKSAKPFAHLSVSLNYTIE